MQIDHTETHYDRWKKKPDQTSLSAVVKSLHPVIDYAIQAAGGQGDPYVRAMAQVHAAKAVTTYDPSIPGAASLNSHVRNQLQGISRTVRKSRSVMQLPERTQLDAFALMKSRKKFEDEHGREPDIGELADHSGFNVKRIEKVMRQTRTTPSESAFESDVEKDTTDFQTEAVDYVYTDSDHVDRRILEHKTGYGGVELLEPAAIAAKLGLTGSQLSRRSARLALKINELESALKTL